MGAPELYVEPDLRGYGWYFPKQDFINIGVGCTGRADGSLPRRRDALLAALRASGRLPAGPADRAVQGPRLRGAAPGAAPPRRRALLPGRRRGRARPRPVGRGHRPRHPERDARRRRGDRACLARRARRSTATRARSWRATAPGSAAGSGGRLAKLPDALARRGGARGPGLERGPAARGVRLHLRHARGGIMTPARDQVARRPSRSRTTTTSRNDFYALFLDPLMVYTCAYYRDPDGKLEQAQEDKLDLVCRKLRLQPGETLLDIGCGWGGFSIWAAQHYGVRAHGVTLSRQQAEWAAARIKREGLDGPVPGRVPRRPRPARGRALRQDRGHRGHRARGHPELPGLLRPGAARCWSTAAST